ncbi:MAG: InlB B-repeat-containing protein [Clostridia bacterium]|nr:InlB B-repeat-containing protein [Clostridia bacterium]
MNRKILVSLLVVALVAAVSLSFAGLNKQAHADGDHYKLVYKLDFEDGEALGKNTAGTTYADATVYNTGLITQVDSKTGKGIMMNAESTAFQNYLSLPTSVFEGQTQVTIAGWFYHPTGASPYLGEIGIFSPENNKAFRADQYASFHSNCYLWVLGNNEAFNSLIFPDNDSWYHMAYVIDGQEVSIYKNGEFQRTYNANWSSVSELHSATSHFYLGQSAYETNHPDFNGGFDDVRVYQSALTEQQIRSEYGIKDPSVKLCYQLDFEDSEALGKNTAGTTYLDATVYNTGLITQQNAKNGKGIMMNAESTAFENYLSLPTDVFEGQSKVTIAGWFYQPTGAAPYLGQIGIFSPENNKAFRADPYAPDYSSCYLWVFGNNQAFNSLIYPVYDAWYHMAYVINGQNIQVYLNGSAVGSFTANWSSVADLHSETSHFYLGQSAYETGHPDFNGGFDDIRIYQSALTKSQLAEEYGLDTFDFMVDEYTFDNAEDLYADNVRGYGMTAFPSGETLLGATSQPAAVDGAMYLDGNAAALIARNDGGELNKNYFYGLNDITFSLDIKVGEYETYTWTRLYDVFIGGKQIISFMAYTGSSASSFDIVYINAEENALGWVMGGQGKSFTFKPGEWFNTVVAVRNGEVCVYIDGTLVVSAKDGSVREFSYHSNSFRNGNAWFTLGGPVYEGDRRINAYFDNFRIFASFIDADDAKTIATEMSRSTVSANLTLINGDDTTEIVRDYKSDYELPALSAEGYEFLGWKDGENNVYTVLPAYTGDITLTACWKEKAGSVTFDANGGRGEMDGIYLSSEERTLPACTFEKTGYDFAGWALSADGEKVFDDQATVEEYETDYELYAVWAAKNYTVSFDANGGEGEMEDAEYVFDVASKLPAVTYTRKGYGFAGWAIAADGAGVYGDEYEFTGLREGNDVTLYATWILKECFVNFNANGGNGRMEGFVINALEMTELPENAYTKDGYDFLGWALSEGGEKAYDDGDSVIFYDDATLYAVWEKIPEETSATDSEETSETVSSDDGSETPASSAKKGGCGGLMGICGATFAVIAVLGATLFVRKKED